MDARPLGVIDSGSGGLSIVQAIRVLLPNESVIYIGDHAYAPYSERSKRVIRGRVKKLIRVLIDKHCKLIIIACNTATVAGIEWYRKQYPDIPIVGVVPTVKTAAAITKTNHICILSTKFTAKSAYLASLIKKFAMGSVVYSVGSTKLVAYIETPTDVSSAVQAELKRLYTPLQKKGIDVVVLGCTHFPFIAPALRATFGPSVTLIDSGAAVARQVSRILEHNAIAAIKPGSSQYFTTGTSPDIAKVMTKLVNYPLVVEHCAIA